MIIRNMNFEAYSERLATLNEYCFPKNAKKKRTKKISNHK